MTDDDFTTPLTRDVARATKAPRNRRDRPDTGRVLSLLEQIKRGTLPVEPWESLP